MIEFMGRKKGLKSKLKIKQQQLGMKKVVLLMMVFISSSCKTLLIKSMIKSPIVETTKTIKEFQTKNNFSTENSLIIKADTSNDIQKLLLGMKVGYYIFDNQGNKVCYNGTSTCHGEQFNQLINNKKDSFKVCKNDSVSLQKVLSQTYDLNEQPVSLSQFKEADYYVVSYWQKFVGGKRGYNDAVTWMEDEIKNNTSNLTFTFIKINTDLQESWGLIAGKKAKRKLTINKGEMDLEIYDLPVKK